MKANFLLLSNLPPYHLPPTKDANHVHRKYCDACNILLLSVELPSLTVYGGISSLEEEDSFDGQKDRFQLVDISPNIGELSSEAEPASQI